MSPILVATLFYCLASSCQDRASISVPFHAACSLLLVKFANRHVATYLFGRSEVAIDFFTEKFKIKKGFDGALYCFGVWLMQYFLSRGFAQPCWIVFMAYTGFLVYRVFGWLETFVPVILRPFPYVNLQSSANVFLWVSLGLELGFDSNLLASTSIIALYLYWKFVITSIDQSLSATHDTAPSTAASIRTYFDTQLTAFDQAQRTGYPFSNLLSLVFYGCFLGINWSFVLIGFVREYNAIGLAGLYGLFEMIWEFFRFEPSYARRKTIVY